MEGGADRVAARVAEPSEKRVQDLSGFAGAARSDQVLARGDERAVRAGSGALPRPAEELRQHSAAKGARVSRETCVLSGAEEDHLAQDRAGDLRNLARGGEEHAGAHTAFAVWRGDQRRELLHLPTVLEPAAVFRRWAR